MEKTRDNRAQYLERRLCPKSQEDLGNGEIVEIFSGCIHKLRSLAHVQNHLCNLEDHTKHSEKAFADESAKYLKFLFKIQCGCET